MKLLAAARDADLLAALASRFEVLVAQSAWQARRLLPRADVVLIAPPYGLDLLRDLRRDKQSAPIICILGQVGDVEAALTLGATLVVTPPLRVDYIVDVIEAWARYDE